MEHAVSWKITETEHPISGLNSYHWSPDILSGFVWFTSKVVYFCPSSDHADSPNAAYLLSTTRAHDLEKGLRGDLESFFRFDFWVSENDHLRSKTLSVRCLFSGISVHPTWLREYINLVPYSLEFCFLSLAPYAPYAPFLPPIQYCILSPNSISYFEIINVKDGLVCLKHNTAMIIVPGERVDKHPRTGPSFQPTASYLGCFLNAVSIFFACCTGLRTVDCNVIYWILCEM